MTATRARVTQLAPEREDFTLVDEAQKGTQASAAGAAAASVAPRRRSPTACRRVDNTGRDRIRPPRRLVRRTLLQPAHYPHRPFDIPVATPAPARHPRAAGVVVETVRNMSRLLSLVTNDCLDVTPKLSRPALLAPGTGDCPIPDVLQHGRGESPVAPIRLFSMES